VASPPRHYFSCQEDGPQGRGYSRYSSILLSSTHAFAKNLWVAAGLLARQQKSYRKKAVAELLIVKQCNFSRSAIRFQKLPAQKRSGRCRPAQLSERSPSLWAVALAAVCSR
jgi:hypothetical protein